MQLMLTISHALSGLLKRLADGGGDIQVKISADLAIQLPIVDVLPRQPRGKIRHRELVDKRGFAPIE